MTKMVKDFIEIKDCTSLDALIENLMAVRSNLPNAQDAEVRMRGDDVFGRKLSISFRRPQTVEEADCDARYTEAYREKRQREADKLQAEQGTEEHATRRRSGRLSIVA